ncbi:MAG: hypothetical protein JWO98_591, partial [Frankiales bacterium]|nr:hypothetical protein [Frankiales bacterium]
MTEETPSRLLAGGVRVATIPFADPYVDAVVPPGTVRVGPPGSPSPWLDADY